MIRLHTLKHAISQIKVSLVSDQNDSDSTVQEDASDNNIETESSDSSNEDENLEEEEDSASDETSEQLGDAEFETIETLEESEDIDIDYCILSKLYQTLTIRLKERLKAGLKYKLVITSASHLSNTTHRGFYAASYTENEQKK